MGLTLTVLRAAARQPASTRGEAPILVGTVGQLAAIKGQDIFVRVAAQLSGRRPRLRFVIIGEDKSPRMSYRKFLADLVAELGASEVIEMAGWRDDMPATLSSLKLFVSAARAEPFGLSIVEAMAAGLPIVAAASEGAVEILEDGVTGKLVPVEDAETLAQTIDDLLDQPLERARLGDNARLAASQRFSLSRMASDTVQVYREVLSSKN